MKIALCQSLTQVVPTWLTRKAGREELERQFSLFTGGMDICELHIPYTKWEYVEQMMADRQKTKGNKLLFLDGDSVNFDMFSMFYPKSKDKIQPKFEREQFIEFLKIASSVYDRIIFLKTNHEARLYKILFKIADNKEQAEAYTDFVESLEETIKKNKINNLVSVDSPFFQIGDVIISHFENNSAVPGSIARQTIQYLIPRIRKAWNVVYQAHTHTQSMLPIDGKLFIETGAMIGSMDYWINGRMNGKGKFSTIGYAVGDMVKGQADLNTCKFVMKSWQEYI